MTAVLSFKALGQELLREVSKDSAASRWLSKKIISSRVLDDMDPLDHWKPFTTGAPEVVDARFAQKAADAGHEVAEMSLSREHSREGRQSLHLRMPSRLGSSRSWAPTAESRRLDYGSVPC